MRKYRTVLVTVVAIVAVVSCQQQDEKTALGAPSDDPEAQTQPQTKPRMQGQDGTPSMRDMDKGPERHVTFRPNEVKWQAGPPSFERGSQMAVLEGDPGAEGVFTIQLKVPDGFVIRPHRHPNVERVTVLRGTLHLGSGTNVDKKAAESLPAGTYTSMPKQMVHYAIAGGETTIQLTSVGPWEIEYVNPEDDPRKRRPQTTRR